jgi:hypothetical protein
MEFAILIIVILSIWWLIEHNQKISAKKAQEQQLARKEKKDALHKKFSDEVGSVASITPFRMNRSYAEAAGVIFNKNETLIMHAPGYLFRNVKIGSKWKTGNKGVRVTPIKGLSFNLGGSKGKMVSDTENQWDDGFFTLTDKRLVFSGEGISFSCLLSKIQNITRNDNELEISTSARDVPNFTAEFYNIAVAELFSRLYSDKDFASMTNSAPINQSGAIT